MKLSEMKDVDMDLRDAGSWPIEVKLGAWIILAVTVLIIGFFMDTTTMLAKLEQSRVYEQSLKGDFEVKYSMASNLSTNENQMELLRRSFSTMLQQLPSETAVGELLEDISQTAVSNGLEIRTFRPGEEQRKTFYMEQPIKVSVSGNYHQFGHFVSDLSELPRIVTIHEIRIYKDKKGSGQKLEMEMTIHSYRYLDEGAR
jgi:type IV pilus assembly protein PilO